MGPKNRRNRKGIAVKSSRIQYCLFMYLLVSKLEFLKLLDDLFN